MGYLKNIYIYIKSSIMLKEKQVKYYMYLWTFHKKTKTNKKQHIQPE